MPRSSRLEAARTEARVRSTARSLFAERGYAAVGLEDVAARAGVTRGAVYHHFASKRGLFEAVLADVLGAVGTAVARAAGPIDEPWESLEVGCRTFLAAVLDPGVRRIALVDAPAVLGWSTWRGADAASSGRLLDQVLHRLADDGRLATTSVAAASALLSGAMNEAVLWAAGADDPRKALGEAEEVLLRLLRALRV
ncbi:TetR/AcrR family transcriptional regulator [Geodermatophilus sp. YIM 151500]|uniref:TetR/AcrR family transcriptional regulator n=1 Tax=Geodermatophilus sp. YIM 151500 TaxID=2984531 RepID=UPI0021E41752|nr:TetR/AcrR family transcriptional regulator [Geodermatophilus sp. YIM 151500]MCV2489909.1 TetR/AcrR family transcriptional regulator [Geodermatophilus sp. YIM 151500]